MPWEPQKANIFYIKYCTDEKNNFYWFILSGSAWRFCGQTLSKLGPIFYAMQYCWFPSTFRLLLWAKHDSERERGLCYSMWEEDSCLCQAGSLAFQHTLCTTDIQWLQEEIDHLKKLRQIFDLDDYPAGVSSSPWCLELLIILLPFMRILLWILML